MTNMYIESEGDMEYGIEHCTHLAKMRGRKYITLAFPSELMYKVFMENFHLKMMLSDDIPDDVNIVATVVLPTENNNGEGTSDR